MAQYYFYGLIQNLNVVTGAKPLSDLLLNTQPYRKLPDLHEDDLIGLFQTSGSTGHPKLVAHSHSTLLNFILSYIHIFGRESIAFNDRPMSWLGGYPYSVFIGQSRLTLSGFGSVPESRIKFVIDVIKREQAGQVFALANVLNGINMSDNLGVNWPVKSILTGGQPITRSMLDGIGSSCQKIVIIYAGSEFTAVSRAIVKDAESYVDGWCGTVMPGVEVKVVDSTGRVVPRNMEGEICVKSKSIFRGYYNDPVKTADVFTEDGFYKTDDLGRLLEDGTLVVEGRKSHMIISGGMNVAPEILEILISKCPGIDSVVVVPVSDDVQYQVVCACVKLVPGSDVDEAVVRQFCDDAHGDMLGLFTVKPKYYLFLDELPVLSTGKYARKQLAALAEKTFKHNH